MIYYEYAILIYVLTSLVLRSVRENHFHRAVVVKLYMHWSTVLWKNTCSCLGCIMYNGLLGL